MNIPLSRRRAGLVVMTVARYVLGLGMLPYAVSKLERMQFQVPAWTYAQPLGNVSGRMLLWATMGYSPKLQMFLGLLEFVPALLLLVRRTRRIGALLMLPVAANVWVLNMGLDLWPATKMISGVLLLLNVFLILYDFSAYRRFFAELLAPPEPIGDARLRTAGVVAAVVVPVVLIGLFLATVERGMHAMQRTESPFIGERQINGAGTWRVVRFDVNGQAVALTPETSTLYFSFGSRIATGTPAHPSTGSYTVDTTKQTIRIEGLQIAGSSSPMEAKYETSGDRLALVGTRDGAPIDVTLQRDGWGPQ